MKLSRRDFLKWLGIGAAGAVLARVAGPVAEDVPRQDVSSVPRHELLSETHCDMGDAYVLLVDDQEYFIPAQRAMGVAMRQQLEGYMTLRLNSGTDA